MNNPSNPIDPEILRFSMWAEFTDRGQILRGDYADKRAAIDDAKKYWLTATGLFRVFVRDREEGDAIIFDRDYAQSKKWRPDAVSDKPL